MPDRSPASASGDVSPPGTEALSRRVEAAALVVRNLAKHFAGQRALDGVSFEIAKGEIVALLGENGSGKSTLVKILAGYHVPEPGSELVIAGRDVPLPVPAGHAREVGLSFVFQDLGLAPSLTVLENLGAGRRLTRHLRPAVPISWRHERHEAAEVFARYGIHIAPGALVRDLRPTEQALLAIVRAAEDLRGFHDRGGAGGGVLVLDEPTVFLPETEKGFLLDLVRRVAEQGTAVIFVSHDLASVRALCRRALVLRDGRLVGDVLLADTSDPELVRLISAAAPAGGTDEPAPPASAAHDQQAAAVALEVCDLEGGLLHGVSFSLHSGEVLGVAGLLGSGSEVLPYALFGALPGVHGSILSPGWSGDVSRLSPRRAIASGAALVPADRQHQSAVGSLSVEKNLLSLVFDAFRRLGVLSHRQMRKAADERLATYRVRPPDPARDMVSLSGGNQQKIVLARWLERRPTMLYLHEPTQGVDVTTRSEIYRIVRGLARRGTAVLWVSTDFEELSAVSDRVLVIDDGVVVDELSGLRSTRDGISAAVYAKRTRGAEAS